MNINSKVFSSLEQKISFRNVIPIPIILDFDIQYKGLEASLICLGHFSKLFLRKGKRGYNLLYRLV